MASRSASSMWMRPLFTPCTTRESTSMPSTRIPRDANSAAVGSPTYPRPTTDISNPGPSSKLAFQHSADALRCVAVAIRIDRARHGLVLGLVVKKTLDLGHDAIGVRTDQSDGPGVDGLRAFGDLEHDQDRLSERRSLFLNAAGIGDQHARPTHQIYEWLVIERLDQEDPIHARKLAVDDIANVGIGMDRVHDLNVVALCQPLDGAADVE